MHLENSICQVNLVAMQISMVSSRGTPASQNARATSSCHSTPDTAGHNLQVRAAGNKGGGTVAALCSTMNPAQAATLCADACRASASLHCCKTVIYSKCWHDILLMTLLATDSYLYGDVPWQLTATLRSTCTQPQRKGSWAAVASSPATAVVAAARGITPAAASIAAAAGTAATATPLQAKPSFSPALQAVWSAAKQPQVNVYICVSCFISVSLSTRSQTYACGGLHGTSGAIPYVASLWHCTSFLAPLTHLHPDTSCSACVCGRSSLADVSYLESML